MADVDRASARDLSVLDLSVLDLSVLDLSVLDLSVLDLSVSAKRNARDPQEPRALGGFRPTEAAGSQGRLRSEFQRFSGSLSGLSNFPTRTIFLANVGVRFWAVGRFQRFGIPVESFANTVSNGSQQDRFGQRT